MGSMILFEGVYDALITQCLPQSWTDTFLNLRGNISKILVQNNFLQRVSTTYIYSDGATVKMIVVK